MPVGLGRPDVVHDPVATATYNCLKVGPSSGHSSRVILVRTESLLACITRTHVQWNGLL